MRLGCFRTSSHNPGVYMPCIRACSARKLFSGETSHGNVVSKTWPPPPISTVLVHLDKYSSYQHERGALLQLVSYHGRTRDQHHKHLQTLFHPNRGQAFAFQSTQVAHQTSTRPRDRPNANFRMRSAGHHITTLLVSSRVWIFCAGPFDKAPDITGSNECGVFVTM